MAGRERSARARKSISATGGATGLEGTQFLKVRLADSKPTSIEFDNVISQAKRVRVSQKTKAPNLKYKCGLCGMRPVLYSITYTDEVTF